MDFNISSTAFEHNAAIPAQYTCEGADQAPPLQWRGVPAKAQSLVLIVDDPDAPDPAAPKRTWVHWVLYNLPANSKGLPEGGAVPESALHGLNDWQRTGYGGPCPPIGRHRYFFKLYALDAALPNLNQPTKLQLVEAMKPHVVGEAVLMGTYQKAR